MEGETTTPTETGNGLRVYFASLADYNAGRLHGVWVDVTPDVTHIRDAIHAMLEQSREPAAEEWAIHDHEGFGPLRLGEHEDIYTLARVAAGVRDFGGWFVPLYAAASDIDEAESWAENHFTGTADSLAVWVQEFVEETYADVLKGLPTLIAYNIDWEGVTREFELGGNVFTVEHDGGVAVFWS